MSISINKKEADELIFLKMHLSVNVIFLLLLSTFSAVDVGVLWICLCVVGVVGWIAGGGGARGGFPAANRHQQHRQPLRPAQLPSSRQRKRR